MTAKTVITILILAFYGSLGCTPAIVPIVPSRTIDTKLDHELHAQLVSSPLPAPVSPEPSALAADDTTPLPALSEDEEIWEETLFTFVPQSANDNFRKTPAKTAKVDEAPKKAATLYAADDSAALQKTPGPRADNRLLDLVEKDIDKAVEKPKERRRLEFSKEVSGHPKVKYFINYFANRGRLYFEKILARSGKYMPMIAKVLNEEGLPEELAYLALIESAFLPSATSSQGAAGLWQFIPSTARLFGLRIDAWVDERRDPEKSTRAAAAYLKELHSYFGRWYLATAAYNAGPGAIDKAMQQSGAKDFWTLSRKAQLSDETRNFVPKFVAVAIIATNPEKYGFGDLNYDSPLESEEFEIRRSLRLGALAEMAESDVSTIRELNPSLVRNMTPPGDESFLVKLPVGKSLAFAQAYRLSPEQVQGPVRSVTHEVRKGETLFSIARRYGQEVSALMKHNGLTNARLRIGQRLTILLQSLTRNLK